MDAYPLMLMVMVISFLFLLMSGFPIAFVLGGVGLLSGPFGWFLYEQGAYNYAPSLNEASFRDGRWRLVVGFQRCPGGDSVIYFYGLMLDKSGMAERMMQSMAAIRSTTRWLSPDRGVDWHHPRSLDWHCWCLGGFIGLIGNAGDVATGLCQAPSQRHCLRRGTCI